MPEKNPYSHYKETQIMTASQGKLIVLLYEGAIKFIDNSINAIEQKKYEVVNNNLLKAQDIITELALSINFDAGELASQMYNLYMFFNKCLLEANIKKDKEKMVLVKDLLLDLLEAWKSLSEKPDNKNVSTGGLNIAG